LIRVRHCASRAALASILLSVMTLTGCGQQPRVAEVEGLLLLNGKPGHKVQIQFVPDIDKGTRGPMSTAQTDAQGRFTLQLLEGAGATRPGAVVGWHRVVLSDRQLAESATGKGVPIRFGPEYTLSSSTPITRQVTEGKQTIEIKIP
jgi:hypothetical protein